MNATTMNDSVNTMKDSTSRIGGGSTSARMTGVSLRRGLVLAAGLAIVLSATGRHAIANLTDDPPAQEDKGFEKPLGKKQGAQNGGGAAAGVGSSTTTMMSDDGTNRYELSIKNGETSAKVNGEAIPADRVVKTDAGYEIRDANGKTLHTFRVAEHGGIRMMWNDGGAHAQPPAAPAVPRAPRAATAPRFRAIAPGVAVARSSNPKVMMGISMSEPEKRLLKHLGVEDGIVVDSVTDGTPAAKAGLQEEDIIVAADDVKPISQDKLREINGKKKPGDTLKLGIVREGKPQDVTLTLEAWDPKVMGGMTTFNSNDLSPFGAVGLDSSQVREMLSAVEEQLQKLKDNPDLQPDALKARADDISKTIQDALQSAIESLKEAHEKIGQGGLNWSFPNNWAEGQGLTFTPGVDDAEARERMHDALQQALERQQEAMERERDARQEALDRQRETLDRQQEEMERRIEKMQEEIEKMRERAEKERNAR